MEAVLQSPPLREPDRLSLLTAREAAHCCDLAPHGIMWARTGDQV